MPHRSGRQPAARVVEGATEVEHRLAAYTAQRGPGLRGFSPQNLWRMRQFFVAYRDDPKLSTLVRVLPWTHNLIVLGRSKSPAEREFYLRMAIQERWSKRELERQFRLAAFEQAVLNPPKVSAVLTQTHAAAASVLTDREPDSVMDEELAEEDAPLTEAQRLEAERRLLEYEAHPERYSTWEEVKRRLETASD